MPPRDFLPLQRLLIRLPEYHHQYENVSSKLYQTKAGHAGEVIVDRVLNEIAFPEGTQFLRDLSLEINPSFLIQIDTLIVTPNQAILLEIKNYAGTVQFQEKHGKTIKINADGESEKYDCILNQLDRTAHGLKTWFAQRNIQLPIEPILVMANAHTDIENHPENVTLLYAKQLPRYIRNLPAETDAHSVQQIQQIASHLFNQQHIWKRKTACEKYQIDPAELKRGVICLTCDQIMTRIQGRTWFCEVCQKPSDGALEQSVADWFLLISPTLRNKQLKHFLDLPSNTSASNVFRQLKLRRSGIPPGTIYTWDYQMPLQRRFKKPT